MIKKRKFVIYCAVESAYDILPMTLYQLDFLCSCRDEIDFEVVFKIKRDSEIVKSQFNNFKYQS